MMTKSEEINQILHQNIKLVFKDAINYKELIQSLLEWNEKQLLLYNVSQQRELLLDYERFTSLRVLGKESNRASKLMVEDYLKSNNCG